MKIDNRAAENGGIIIEDTNLRTEFDKPVIGLEVLEDGTTIGTICSGNMENIEWYEGKSLYVDSGCISANITQLRLTSGAVKLTYE